MVECLSMKERIQCASLEEGYCSIALVACWDIFDKSTSACNLL